MRELFDKGSNVSLDNFYFHFVSLLSFFTSASCVDYKLSETLDKHHDKRGRK